MGLRLLWRCGVPFALATFIVGCDRQASEPSAAYARFFEAADSCNKSLCSTDFVTNKDCQTAWEMQTKLPPAKSKEDELAYFQGRLVIGRAYQRALEVRLGQSHQSRLFCSQKLEPLDPIVTR